MRANEKVVRQAKDQEISPSEEPPQAPPIEMGRQDPFAPPGYEPPAETPVVTETTVVVADDPVEDIKRQLLEVGADYAKYSKQELNDFYDQLRAKDPLQAAEVGKDINQALYGF
tara:strand:- start:222 stop:563 length:342 start_codon:yes stop_codon:yes gene_type:complete